MPSFPWAKRQSQPHQVYQQQEQERNPTLPNVSLNDEDYEDQDYDTDPRQPSQTFDRMLDQPLNNSTQRWYRAPSTIGGKSTHKDNSDEYYDQPQQPQQTSPKSNSSQPAARKSFKARLGGALAFASRDNLADYANEQEPEKPRRTKSVLRKGAPSSYKDPGGSPVRTGGQASGTSQWANPDEQEPHLPRIPGAFTPEARGDYDNDEDQAMNRLSVHIGQSDSLRPDAWVQSREQVQPQQMQERPPASRQHPSYNMGSSQGHAPSSLDQAQQYGSLPGNRPSSRLGLLKDERASSPNRQIEAYTQQPSSSPGRQRQDPMPPMPSPSRQRQDPLNSPMLPRQPQQTQGIRPNSSTPVARGSVLSQSSPLTAMDRMGQQGGILSSPVARARQSSQVADGASSPITGNGEEPTQQLEVLKTKYINVKRQYFNQKKQLELLQETMATKNLSESRTSLDDGEYAKRLESLDGSIRELAFSIRKHWRSLPSWIEPYVSEDAIQAASKEMIAVGRAFISQWLYENIFRQHFHPALPEALSLGLKACQQTLGPQTGSSADASSSSLARATTWRLATIDGLAASLSPSSTVGAANTEAFVSTHTQGLVSALSSHLIDPPPTELHLATSISSIIDAVSKILSHIPLESRDIHVRYYMPETPVDTDVMKLESTTTLGSRKGGTAGSLAPETAGRKRAVSKAGSTNGTGEDDNDYHSADEGLAEESKDGAAANGANLEDGDEANTTDISTAGITSQLRNAMASAAAAVSSISTNTKSDNIAGTMSKAGEEAGGHSRNQSTASAGGRAIGVANGAAPGEKKVRMCVFLGAQVRGKDATRTLHMAPCFGL